MNKRILAFLCSILVNCLVASIASASPSAALVQELNAQVLRVQVKHNNGSHGLGSAVVIGKDHVVTNCHVVTDAHDVEVIVNGVSHVATEVKPDWHHDLCILTVANLNAPIAKMGGTKSLKYEASVFTVGYPDKTTQPVNTFGVVKEMFPMDGSVVIRATSPFRLGASGGGVFDESGSLVGIITLKSRGTQAHYYYMPVEWVQALMQKPAQVLGAKSEKPFWAANDMQKPYFMQVVQPYVSKDWKSLLAISLKWVSTEPNTAESWFYLAMAEYETNAYDKAVEHLNKVLSLNEDHVQAIAYLNKITQKTTGA
ncbi:MAG: trypsin-like peptidase domain-containing protein [Methylotenera sp.]|uniref:trypsin-like peptidase domain-containing protein n=1 Tax=Methylotenera sp. TaxID=2051956 RepID=UPI0024886041|nr:trypsin-like peptidase domain-containing protein [Methylotenera sp.]MDI1309701.1 trypsin-like peptidase domain-containing protein [Methylotenera sp.]